MGAPPEVIHDDNDAIAVCKSPDFCKTPVGSATPPIPYMVFGKGGDDKKYPKSVKSNGLTLKTTDSKFTKTYGDEPGIAKGVKSGTVGDVVEPVTKSSVVRIEGQWVIRHGDKCTLNKGNCPGEYIHVKSVEAPTPPDGSNEEPTFFERLQEMREDYTEQRHKGSKPRQFAEDTGEFIVEKYDEYSEQVTDKIDDYINDPSQIKADIEWVWEQAPTQEDILEAGKDALEYGEKILDGADYVKDYVIENPIQSAKNVWGYGVEKGGDLWNWAKDGVVDGVTGFKDGVSEAYQDGGVAGTVGYLEGTGETVVAAVGMAIYDPFKKIKKVGQAADAGLDGLQAAAKAKAKAEAAEAAAKAKAAQEAAEAAAKKKAAQGGAKKKPNSSGKDGTRSTGKPKPVPRKDVECFNKPKDMSDKEFKRQLDEQEGAINNMDAEEMLKRRQAIKDAGGTKSLRDHKAQKAARDKYRRVQEKKLSGQGYDEDEVADIIAKDLKGKHATHRLDIIAGGDPSDISGMGDGKVNSSLGSQWKGRRSQELEDHAKAMKANGQGKDKMNVKLRKC